MSPNSRQRLSTFTTIGKKALSVYTIFCALTSASRAQHVDSARPSTLQRAATVLQGIAAMSNNGVPDAVLNNTKCLVLVPSLTEHAPNVSGQGVATCRGDDKDSWSAATLIRFTGRYFRAHKVDLLVFILRDSSVRALRSGDLQVGRQDQAPAPLVNTNPVATQGEITAEYFIYERARGVLSSSNATGVINASPSTRHGHRLSKSGSDKYVSSVVSFFNTITPTGIVFHHTAVIPGENKPPRSERDVDKYHQERGFEIRCSGRVYHVAYHYLIMSNGTVKAGRPERCEGGHAVGYNSYLGISLVGDFSSEDNPVGKKGPARPNPAQIASLVQLCRRLRKRYNIPVAHIIRHSDISKTQCPGDRFPYREVLEQLQRKSRR